MANSRILFDWILSFEGGYVNDPDDAGGCTNKGVTIGVWKAYFNKNATCEDMKKLTTDDALKVFERKFWGPMNAGQIKDQAIANTYVDWGWASGPDTVKNIFKRVFNTNDFISFINSSSNPQELFNRIQRERLLFIDKIIIKKPRNKKFESGWKRRINSIKYNTLTYNDGKVITFNNAPIVNTMLGTVNDNTSQIIEQIIDTSPDIQKYIDNKYQPTDLPDDEIPDGDVYNGKEDFITVTERKKTYTESNEEIFDYTDEVEDISYSPVYGSYVSPTTGQQVAMTGGDGKVLPYTPFDASSFKQTDYLIFPFPNSTWASPMGHRAIKEKGYKPGSHNGTDFGAKDGTVATAVWDGVIIGFGKSVGGIIYFQIKNHARFSGYVVKYTHQRFYGTLNVGSTVKRGDPITITQPKSATGYSPHLHIEIYKNRSDAESGNGRSPLNPTDYFYETPPNVDRGRWAGSFRNKQIIRGKQMAGYSKDFTFNPASITDSSPYTRY